MASHEWSEPGTAMLTLKEVAATVRVAESTVRRWIRGGTLPAYKLGKRGQVRVSSDDLQHFLEQQRLTVGPQPAPEDGVT